MWFKKEIPRSLAKHNLKANIGFAYTDFNLVGQYNNAIDILFNKILDESLAVDLIAHPILYLMRHSIELALKENIKYLTKYSGVNPSYLRSHSVEDLCKEFEKHFLKISSTLNFDNKIINEFENYYSDLKILVEDLGSDFSSFRYVHSRQGEKVFGNNEIVRVDELKKKYDSSMELLIYTSDVISPYTDYIDYVDQDSSIIPHSFGKVFLSFDVSQKDFFIGKMNEDYITIDRDEKWFSKDELIYYDLKCANNKYYIIPMKAQCK